MNSRAKTTDETTSLQHLLTKTAREKEIDESGTRAFRRKLLSWFNRERRDLPWRRRDDAYAIWISEVMLQQTRVEVVAERFTEFLGRFPDIHSLARAEEEDVLSLWSGLGYYTRARQLLRGAHWICERHGGGFPGTIEEARRVPGVGAYTSAAVLSIAYGLPHAVVDGNVARVLSRLFRLDPPEDSPARLAAIAARLLDAKRPGDHNQAMMELGALICLPARPRCPECPVRLHCRARVENVAQDYPRRRERPPSLDLIYHLLLLRDTRGRLLLEKGRWRFLTHMWLPPIVDPAARKGRDLTLLGEFRHTITRHRICFHVFRGRAPKTRERRDILFADEETLRSIGRSAVLSKAVRLEKK